MIRYVQVIPTKDQELKLKKEADKVKIFPAVIGVGLLDSWNLRNLKEHVISENDDIYPLEEKDLHNLTYIWDYYMYYDIASNKFFLVQPVYPEYDTIYYCSPFVENKN